MVFAMPKVESFFSWFLYKVSKRWNLVTTENDKSKRRNLKQSTFYWSFTHAKANLRRICGRRSNPVVFLLPGASAFSLNYLERLNCKKLLEFPSRYFDKFLGRIEIMGSSKRVEKIYFEIQVERARNQSIQLRNWLFVWIWTYRL